MSIKFSKLNRTIHYWGSSICAIPVLLVIVTGIMLLLKKDFDWIQPPTIKGQGTVPQVTFEKVIDVIKTIDDLQIKDWSDIDRLDVRPKKGIIKVQLNNNWEVQIDHQTGEVLHTAFRRSDIIESLHDGKFFGKAVSKYLFLPSAVILLTLWITGVYLFVTMLLTKRKNRKKRKMFKRG